jgi:Tfp pilus assembly protein FimT
MMTKNSGFTALGLATIAIVTMIAALVMPPYLRWYRTRGIERALVNLTSDLKMAKAGICDGFFTQFI